MENQRRNALKKVLLAVTGAVGMGLWARGEQPAAQIIDTRPPADGEKEAFNVVYQQEVPLFSGSTKHRGLVFVAGKGAHFEGDIKAHTDHVLKELEKELIAAGSSMEKVLKVSVFLNDIEDYKGMNEVYQGRFGSKPPVRTTVAVSKGGVPGNSLVEMDCIAYT
jgi:2-iminobutanoate/2-iminopropanoate deaminase